MKRAVLHPRDKNVGQYHIETGDMAWIVEITDSNRENFIYPLTGNFAGGGLAKKNTLSFKTKELAIKYLQKNSIEYTVAEKNNEKGLFFRTYTQNFIS